MSHEELSNVESSQEVTLQDGEHRREPGCTCHQEIGDSNCPIHNEPQDVTLLNCIECGYPSGNGEGKCNTTSTWRSEGCRQRARHSYAEHIQRVALQEECDRWKIEYNDLVSQVPRGVLNQINGVPRG